MTLVGQLPCLHRRGELDVAHSRGILAIEPQKLWGITFVTALVMVGKDTMLGKRVIALIITGATGLAFALLGLNAFRASADSGPSTQVSGDVVINELMYHPAAGVDDCEYVELTNTGTLTVDLSGWRFSDGFDYVFPTGTLLSPNGYLVVAHDPVAVAGQYGLDLGWLLGPFAAKRLSNGGERVALCDGRGELVDKVTYDDDLPWPEEPDGQGPSLELINPAFDNDRACLWAASSDQGTPGAQNSVYALDVSPCVEGVIHSPLLPTSIQTTTVTARIEDDSAITTATVYHRRDDGALFDSAVMLDDGCGADAVPGDGVYTAQLPPYADGTLVEYYVAATDDAGSTTRAPRDAPGKTSSETGRPVTIGYLFLVEDVPPTSERPIYRLLVTGENWNELTTRDLFSNELLDATSVYGDEVHYNVGLRYRGESSRRTIPRPYRVDFPSTHLFQGVERLNLVSDHISREALTFDLFRRAGMVASDAEFVDLHINADPGTLYLSVEQVDQAFLSAHFSGDDVGNLYRAKDGGDLSYRGPNPDDYRPYYLKKSNESADDYSDVIALTDALDNSPEESFKVAAETVADMDQWLRWFALNALVFNQEGALFMGQGDDYFLYHRPQDDRFVLLPWDHDSTFYYAQGDIWAPNLRIIKRILRHPPFTRLYYQNIVELMADEFSVATMHPLIDALPSELEGDKNQLKQFVTQRMDYLTRYFNDNLPDRPLSITTNAGQSFTTTQRTVTLEGECSPWRDVYVNGEAEGITYPSIYDWRYTSPPLRPRANRFVVTDRDTEGRLVTTHTITVSWDTFDGGLLTENLTLTLDASPHIILEDIIVPPSHTLTIEPGVTVALAEGTSVFVEGQLLAEGTGYQPITFTRDQGGDYWGAIGLCGSQEGGPDEGDASVRLAHTLVAYAGQDSYEGHVFYGVSAYQGQLVLEDSEIRDASHAALDLVDATSYLRRNWVHDVPGGAGLRVQGGFVEVEDNLFHDLYGDVAGIYLSEDDGSLGGAIRGNRVYGVQGDCINLDGRILSIEANEIHHCTGAGISLYDTADVTDTILLYPTTVNNLIHHSAVGVALKNGAGLRLAHNTLVSNTVGVALYHSVSQVEMINNIVWGNGTAISVTTGASVTVSYSDVQGGWSGPGEGNMDADPQFRRPDLAVFRLLETSPCIDRATPDGASAIDIMGISRPKGAGYDMGAYEFFEYHSVYLPLVVDEP